MKLEQMNELVNELNERRERGDNPVDLIPLADEIVANMKEQQRLNAETLEVMERIVNQLKAEIAVN